MTFGAPIALAGGLACLIPVLVHLRQRPERPRVAAAITFFVRADSRPLRRRWVIQHLPLLLTRTGLLAMITLWLAQPYIDDPDAGAGQTWTLVAPDASDDAIGAINAADNMFWLAPGLPPIETPRPAFIEGTTWASLWAADQRAPAGAAITVLAPTTAAAMTGVRPVLSREITWTRVAADTTVAPRPTSPQLELVTDSDRADSAARIADVVDAWRATGLDIALSVVPPDEVKRLNHPTVWLSDRPWPPDAAQGAVVITDRPAPDAFPLTIEGGLFVHQYRSGGVRVVSVADGLAATSGPMALPAFADQLLWLAFGEALWSARATSDVPPVSLQPRVDPKRAPARPIGDGFLMVALGLFALERILAYRAAPRR
ncbi:MAG: BatA domain-containing protein [Pseudomonadota bacterium]